MFELGVRLAASDEPTACIIDKNWEEFSLKPWREQQKYFVSHFVQDGFQYDSQKKWQTQRDVFVNAFINPPRDGLLGGRLHKLVEQKLDIDSEPASQPVYRELIDQAALFARDPGSAGRSKPVGLFPGNLDLVEREENAEFERLLAAFFFIYNRYELNQILTDPNLCKACKTSADLLFQRHDSRLSPEMRKILEENLTKIE